jgi:hypothetical protein
MKAKEGSKKGKKGKENKKGLFAFFALLALFASHPALLAQVEKFSLWRRLSL